MRKLNISNSEVEATFWILTVFSFILMFFFLRKQNSYYIPPPAGGWFNLEEIKKKWYEAKTESTSNTRFLGASPAIFYRDDINQTVFYAAANADVVRALGLPANVTETFTSAVWPPVDPKIVFQGPQNATAANGLLGAIPVRYAYNVQYDRDSSDSKSSNKYSALKFIAVKDGASLDTKVREVVFKWADDLGGYRNDPLKPFGGVYFEALDMNKQAIQMTMQYGVPPQSGWYNDGDLGSGIRQMVTMTQMTSALVKIKYAGKYVITQGLRALPYEFDPNWLNGYMLNEISMYLFPFGLSFLLPTFVALLVQEKEDRHRAMMAMVNAEQIVFIYGVCIVGSFQSRARLNIMFAPSITFRTALNPRHTTLPITSSLWSCSWFSPCSSAWPVWPSVPSWSFAPTPAS